MKEVEDSQMQTQLVQETAAMKCICTDEHTNTAQFAPVLLRSFSTGLMQRSEPGVAYRK